MVSKEQVQPSVLSISLDIVRFHLPLIPLNRRSLSALMREVTYDYADLNEIGQVEMDKVELGLNSSSATLPQNSSIGQLRG